MSDVRCEAAPTDANGDDAVLADWAAELAERLGRGEPVDLDGLAGAHPERAGELQRILPAIRRMASFGRAVGRPPGAIGAPDRPECGDELGTLGDFRLLREVGRGGMGVVYEAEQVSLSRRVALKILPLAGALDPRHHQRFLLEARAAACLHHAHIVPVHAVGSERGVPFYAMQFIEGRTLAQVIGGQRGCDHRCDPDARTPVTVVIGPPGSGPPEWPAVEPPTVPASAPPAPLGASNRERGYIRAVAEHGRHVAEALDHAHALGIIHRDIKPANLMLDAEGRIWVMDFGLARFQGASNLTLTGDVIGTLRYMSPEQAMGRRVVVDGRTDIYSLGATLYELLTLRPVFDGADRTEILQQIAHDEPASPRQLNPAIPADLETIVGKTLAKEPSDRYATARDLADDLGRFLDGRPIAARPPGAMERFGRWARRNRALVASAAAFAVLAVVSLAAGLIWSNGWLRAHNERLRLERDRASTLARELASQRDIAEERRRIADRHVYASRLQQAGTSLRARQFEVTQEILRGLVPGPDVDDLREFAWHHLWRESRREVATLSEWGERVSSIALSADGRAVATGDQDGTIRVRDTATGALRVLFRSHHIAIRTLAFSADGRRLASGTSHDPKVTAFGQGELVVWDVASGRPLARLDGFQDRFIDDVRFDPSGAHLWERSDLRGDRIEVGLWGLEGSPDAPRPRLIRRWGADYNFPVSVDGRRVAGYEDGRRSAVVAEALSGRVLLRLPREADRYRGIGLSADGRRVATATAAVPGGCLRLAVREVDTGRLLVDRRDAPSGNSIDRLAFSPDGRGLVALGVEGTIRHVDVETGESWVYERDPADEGRFSGDFTLLPEGRLLAWEYNGARTGARPLRICDRSSGRIRATFPGRPGVSARGVGAPDGRWLVFGCDTRAVIWHFQPEADPQPGGHSDEAWSAAFSGDGRTLVTGSDDTDEPLTLKFWDATTGRLERGWKPHEATTAAVAFSRDGRVLATGGLKNHDNLRLWEPANRRLLATLEGHTDGVRSLAFSPDGRRLASAGTDRTIRLWNVATRRCIRVLNGHTDKIRQVAFSPDGRTLVSVGGDGAVRLWDCEGPEPIWDWKGGVKIAAVAFSPDGRLLAWAHEDGVIQRLDVAARRRLAPSHVEHDELMSLAFSPDGQTLAAGSKSGNIHLCDPISGQVTLTLEVGPHGQANAVAFSPDGSTLAACWHDGSVRIIRAR